jgi:hypothetical protein
MTPWRSSQGLCGSYEFREWKSAIADAKTMLAGITTMVNETKTMVGDMKPFTERQKQFAKPFRPWSKTRINLLNNMKIQLYPISTMVGGANTLVGSA